MEHVCTISTEKEVKVLKIRTRTSVDNMPTTLGQCYGRILAYMQEKGIQMSGAPFTAYYNMDMNDLDVEVGIPILSEATSDQDIIYDVLAQSDYLSTTHCGPYDTVASAYKDLSDYIESKQLEVTGVAYEFYLNDPSEVKAEEILTKVMFPLKASS